MDSGGGGRAQGVGLEVGMCCGMVGGWCDSHCLWEVSWYDLKALTSELV